jgi:hypothetical protein
VLLSNIKTSGTGLLALIADQDGNLDGSVKVSPQEYSLFYFSSQ